MLELKGYIIKEFPYETLKKVSDLVYYDGPILSHFKDESDNSYLYYWIEKDDTVNRWLIFKVSDLCLYEYLTNQKSLKELITETTSEFHIIVDIDDNFNYHNITFIPISQLNSYYLPDNDSYYQLPIPDRYELFIKSRESSDYAEILRKNAIYFKIEPVEIKYPDTYPINEITSFLNVFNISYQSFIEYRFINDLKDFFKSDDNLKKAINAIKKDLEPRIVYHGAASLIFGIASDYIMNNEGLASNVRDFKTKILSKYNDEVFDIDYESEESINKIINKVTPEYRYKIYQPIIKTINSRRIKLNLADKDHKIIRTYKSIPQKVQQALIPSQLEKRIIKEDKKKLIELIIEVKGDRDLAQIPPKELKQGILFSQEVDEFPYNTKNIDSKEHILELREEMEFIIKYKDGNYLLKYEPLKIELINQSKNNLLKDLFKNIIDQFLISLEEEIPIWYKENVYKFDGKLFS